MSKLKPGDLVEHSAGDIGIVIGDAYGFPCKWFMVLWWDKEMTAHHADDVSIIEETT